MLTADWALENAILIAPVVLSCVPATPFWNVAMIFGALGANRNDRAKTSPVFEVPLQAFTELKQEKVTPVYAVSMFVLSATLSKLRVVSPQAPAAPSSDIAAQNPMERIVFLILVILLSSSGTSAFTGYTRKRWPGLNHSRELFLEKTGGAENQWVKSA